MRNIHGGNICKYSIHKVYNNNFHQPYWFVNKLISGSSLCFTARAISGWFSKVLRMIAIEYCWLTFDFGYVLYTCRISYFIIKPRTGFQ